jgi:hypothetical protein
MSKSERKAAIAEYKKRKSVPGVYAVRCAATGQIWVGQALDIEAIETRIRFGLRTNGSPQKSLQAAWNEHGEGAFSFEQLELLDGDGPATARDSLMKDRLAHWKGELKAEQI